jgi:hypothetical protein
LYLGASNRESNELQALLSRINWALDSGDMKTAASMFTEDSELEYAGERATGRAGVEAFFGRKSGRFTNQISTCINSIADRHAPPTYLLRSYLFIYKRFRATGSRSLPTLIGQYSLEDFIRSESGVLMVQRRSITLLTDSPLPG